MGESMFFRDLYHMADQPLDVPRAKVAATRLAATASLEEITVFLEDVGASVADSPAIPNLGDTSPNHLDQLRAHVERALHQLLDQFADSLTSPEVCSFRFEGGDVPGVHANTSPAGSATPTHPPMSTTPGR